MLQAVQTELKILSGCLNALTGSVSHISTNFSVSCEVVIKKKKKSSKKVSRTISCCFQPPTPTALGNMSPSLEILNIKNYLRCLKISLTIYFD